jgi:2',3'-cyclic-nucleotide 2'-phosphodiesterase (5'-nucleotidase family)
MKGAVRLLLGLLLVPSGLSAAPVARTTVTLLFTSDLHAHVLPYDDVAEQPAHGSIAQVATVVHGVEEEARNVIVLDGGDAIEGTPLAYYALPAEGGDGHNPTIAAMNLVGYDAAIVGNHEFNFGLDVLRAAVEQSRFPWLAANLRGGREVGLPVGDELILERGGVRVAILGLTNPNEPRWDPPEHLRGLAFADPVAVARQRVPGLRRRADVVVVVAHTGFERDPSSTQESGGPSSGAAASQPIDDPENFAWRLAHVPGIDVLLTGHTHRNILPRLIGPTIVAQPGRWGELVTRVDLEMERDAGGWRIAGWHGANLPTAGAEPDARVVAAVGTAHEREVKALAEPVATLTAPLAVGGVPLADDASVDLVHAAQLEASGAQLSLAAPLSGRRMEVPAGTLTVRTLHALYPYPNTLTVVRLTGAELRDVLEHAVAGWTGIDCTSAPGCRLLRARDRPPYDYDSLEGATYLVDPAAPVGHRVRGLRIAGRPPDAHDSFTVVVNSYRAAGGGGYPHLASVPRVREIGRQMVDVLIDYCRRQGRITPEATDNWAFLMPLTVIQRQRGGGEGPSLTPARPVGTLRPEPAAKR